MASATIKGGSIFAEGTSVGAYPTTQVGPEGGPPTGTPVATATVLNGNLVFGGLANNTEYIAYAASPNRYKRFRTDAVPVGAGVLASETPTLEELQFAITTTTSGVTTAGNLVLASAMFPMKIAAFSIINSSANPGSATNLWTFTLERLRNVSGVATAATIATKTTYKAGGGEDMIANVDWPWDAVAFDATNQLLQKGDVLRIGWAPTGAPTALQVRCYTVRYEPI